MTRRRRAHAQFRSARRRSERSSGTVEPIPAPAASSCRFIYTRNANFNPQGASVTAADPFCWDHT
ncbi:hypothetical protein FQA47_005109 [Oryzias melastigma]|uniref:Uncharacterized protein n=1 Tax=Oryzias melastigma TaxID=30732 RepID=A0A834CNS2_ORYME|nr:hypothetical protein FQA47_005109 [Oryzias melastigma]